jgi:hypothetical protein
MPVRISARSLGPLRNAATVTSCKYPLEVNALAGLPVGRWDSGISHQRRTTKHYYLCPRRGKHGALYFVANLIRSTPRARHAAQDAPFWPTFVHDRPKSLRLSGLKAAQVALPWPTLQDRR